jgi:hypothetical protein
VQRFQMRRSEQGHLLSATLSERQPISAGQGLINPLDRLNCLEFLVRLPDSLLALVL